VQAGGTNKGKFVCQVVGDGTFLFSVPGSVYWIAQRYNIPILTFVHDWRFLFLFLFLFSWLKGFVFDERGEMDEAE